LDTPCARKAIPRNTNPRFRNSVLSGVFVNGSFRSAPVTGINTDSEGSLVAARVATKVGRGVAVGRSLSEVLGVVGVEVDPPLPPGVGVFS